MDSILKTLTDLKDFSYLFEGLGTAVLLGILAWIFKLPQNTYRIVRNWWKSRLPKLEIERTGPVAGRGRTLKFKGTAGMWTVRPLNSEVKLTLKVRLDGSDSLDPLRHPDFRIHISSKMRGYPRLIIICPWELQENATDQAECHINWTPGPFEYSGDRLFQLPINKRLELD